MRNRRSDPLPLDTLGNKPRLLTKRNSKPTEKSKPISVLETPCASSQTPQKGKNTPQINRKEMKYKLSQDFAGIVNKRHLIALEKHVIVKIKADGQE